MLGHGGQGGASLALGLVGMSEGEEAAQVGVAAQVARDEDQLLTVDLQRAADDGLDAELAARLQVADRTVHAATVGDRERRHLELCGPHRQLIRMRAAVQEREVGVAVELDIGRHPFGSPAVSRT